MADVPFIPCKFDKGGWAPCKKPSTNGLCSQHESLRCSSCGQQALTHCDEQMGGMACRSPLCETCHHSLLYSGPMHVTKEVYAQQCAERDHPTPPPPSLEDLRQAVAKGLPTMDGNGDC